MVLIGSTSEIVAVPTSGATFDITVSGIGTPKAYTTRWIGATANDTPTVCSRLGLGVSDGTNHRCAAAMAENGQLTNLNDSGFLFRADSVAILTGTIDESIVAQLTHNSFITNGVRLNIDDPPASGLLLEVTFFYGDDLTALVLEWTGSGTNGSSVTVPSSLDFTKGLMGFVYSVYDTGAVSTSGANARMSAGFVSYWPARGTILQCAHGVYDRDRPGLGNNTAGASVLRDDACAAYLTVSTAGALNGEAWHELTAISSSDLTVTTRNANVAFTSWGLFLKVNGHPTWCGIPSAATLNTDTTGDRVIDNGGFQGKHAFAISSGLLTKNSASVAASGGVGRVTLGFSNGTRNYSGAWQVQDASATSATHCVSSNTRSLGVLSNDGSAIDWLGKITTFAQAGFTLNIASGENSASDRLAAFAVMGEVFNATGAISRTATLAGLAQEKFQASSALVRPHATLAGSAAEKFSATGSTTRPATLLAGTALYKANHAAGAFLVAKTVLLGSALETFRAQGVIALGPTVLAGAALERFSASAALLRSPTALLGAVAERFQAVGTQATAPTVLAATALERFLASGALQTSPAVLLGAAAKRFSASGALAAAAALFDGAALERFSASAALQGSPTTLLGAAAERFQASGALANPPAVLAGTATAGASATFYATGALSVGAALFSGAALERFLATGSFLHSGADLLGAATERFIASGAIARPPTVLEAQALERFQSSGALQPSPATLQGAVLVIFRGNGTFAVPHAVLSGAALERFVATGQFTVPHARMVGTDSEAIFDLVVFEAGRRIILEFQAGRRERVDLDAGRQTVYDFEAGR